MKKFELEIMALVKRKVVVEISEEDYNNYCDDDLNPMENAKAMYEDDKYYYFENVEEIPETDWTIHEEVLSVEELPRKGEEEIG